MVLDMPDEGVVGDVVTPMAVAEDPVVGVMVLFCGWDMAIVPTNNDTLLKSFRIFEEDLEDGDELNLSKGREQSVLILQCWKLHATRNGPAFKQSTTPITCKSNDNHQSRSRVTTGLQYTRISNRYARKDIEDRTRREAIKSPVSPLPKVSPLSTRRNSAKLKTQFPFSAVILT